MTLHEATEHASLDAVAYGIAAQLHRAYGPDKASIMVDLVGKYQQGLARGENPVAQEG